MQLPDWFMNYGNKPGYQPWAPPADYPGATPAKSPYGSLGPAPNPTGSFFANVPVPSPRPSDAALAAYNTPAVPVPPVRPPELSVPDNVVATTAPSYAGPTDDSNNAYWLNERARQGDSGDQIGPGHWFNPDSLGKLFHPNSVAGKLVAMRNPKPAPTAATPQQPQGLLPMLYHGLFDNGGIFGTN